MICLVTDRRRLATAIGLPPWEWDRALVQQVEAACDAGVDMVQVREPDLKTADLMALVRSLVNVAAGTGSKVLVNDRLDVALAAHASGVHLKESGFLAQPVRQMVPQGFLIGCSVHSADAAAARRMADYLIAGTILPTASKTGVEHLGENGLQAIVRAAEGVPVLGIGGLGIPSVPLLTSAGAVGLAAVSAFIPTAGEPLPAFVQKRVTDLRFALESASPPI